MENGDSLWQRLKREKPKGKKMENNEYPFYIFIIAQYSLLQTLQRPKSCSQTSKVASLHTHKHRPQKSL